MSDIGDQCSEKTVAFVVQAVKLDAKMLAKAIDMLLKGGEKLLSEKDMTGKGQQTVKQLVKQGKGVSNIEITDKNIKSFESIAKKYGIDFAMKKDNTVNPPKWLVIFKAQDADALTTAFKEFSAKEARRTAAKPSVLASLKNLAELVKNQVIDKVKNKSREGHEL